MLEADSITRPLPVEVLGERVQLLHIPEIDVRGDPKFAVEVVQRAVRKGMFCSDRRLEVAFHDGRPTYTPILRYRDVEVVERRRADCALRCVDVRITYAGKKGKSLVID